MNEQTRMDFGDLRGTVPGVFGASEEGLAVGPRWPILAKWTAVTDP